MAWFVKERTLGVARGKRRYDLPLSHSPGTRFLMTLMALMTFLSVLALAASFTFSAVGKRWSSGLENRMTVEIPATDSADRLRQPEQIQLLAAQIDSLLKSHPDVGETHILSQQEIAELVKPWLSGDLLLSKMPLPGLVSVTLKETRPETLQFLAEKIRALADNASLDTHQDWLRDLLRFTGALQFAAIVLALTIGVTTITAVAGAVRSRMAEYKADVEILHLMGASDLYIARQFQRHSLVLALMGSLAGALAGMFALYLIIWLAGRADVGLLPDFRLAPAQIGAMAAIPPFTALLAAITARRTVLRNLASLP